jgi:spore coat polysaccharide biosynthesis predicted glycosyltransferase SpsG
MSGVLIKLLIDEGVFSVVADSLLVYEKAHIEFKTLSIRSYSNENELEEIEEQVAGYLAKVQVEIMTTQENYTNILAYLRDQHPRLQCHYFITPVLESGVL